MIAGPTATESGTLEEAQQDPTLWPAPPPGETSSFGLTARRQLVVFRQPITLDPQVTYLLVADMPHVWSGAPFNHFLLILDFFDQNYPL